VKIEKRFDPDLPDLIGSEDQLQQVFMNIISNAVEAMESKNGGTLTIQTALSLEDNSVRIIFTDTGVGISPENLTKLFEPFYTTKKKGKGVGLGLSVAYGIVQEHGGSIKVASTPGGGTTFRVSLPLKQIAETRDQPGGMDG
jgi:signal transduction histidine kinase